MLYPNAALENEPREYNLFAAPAEKQRARKPGQALVFSEKDLPGYKPKTFAWDDVDEEGNPGQGRSFLYERHWREQKKKENAGKPEERDVLFLCLIENRDVPESLRFEWYRGKRDCWRILSESWGGARA